MKRLLSLLCVLWMLGSMACYLDRNVQCTADQDCLGGSTCQQSKCACPGNQTFCNQGTREIVCVDLKTSAQHCGSCGKSCAAGERCADGRCIGCDASKGDVLCGGACVNTKSNPQHCGSCDNECKGGRECKEGKCECPTGFSVCNETCVNTSSNKEHCGTCDKKCPAGQFCTKGQCGACDNKCGDECPDLKTDKNHCGACDNKCKDAESCCDGSCANLQTSADHCGQCDNKCAQGSSCTSGSCDCGQGQTSCSGACVDTKTSTSHCGQCGNACASGQSCDQGVCCKAGETNCSGACVDTKTSTSHCGACGTACNGQICDNGSCRACQKDSECSAGLTCDQGVCVCGPKCGWLATLGTSGAEIEGFGVAVDSNQNVYVTGKVRGDLTYTVGTNQNTLKANGSGDILVAKLDAAGAVLWVKRFGGSGADEGRSVAVDSKGMVIVTGSFTDKVSFGSGQDLTAANQSQDIFVLALDTSGAVQWVKRAGGEGIDTGLALALDGKGAVFVTGRFAKKASFGSQSLPANGKTATNSQALFLVKMDTSNGSTTWALGTTGTSDTNVGSATGTSVAVASSGAIYVGGVCSSTIKANGNDLCTTGSDAFLLEAKADGSAFAAGVSTLGSAQTNAVAVDASGTPFAAGYFQASVKFESGYNATGALDAFFHQFKTPLAFNKTIAFATKANEASEARGLALSGTTRYVVGDFTGEITLEQAQTSQGGSDIFVGALDNTNAWSWARSAGGSKDDKAYAVAVDSQGGLIVVGSFQDKVDSFATGSSPTSVSAKGSKDLFVWKLPLP